jgi:all-trans-retinol 13,14-reductase
MQGNKRKMPGMLYIIVSFIPWIVYWVLCSIGNVLGIVIPFVISLLLITPQIRERSLNLMDLASTLYFSIATVGTFIFNLNIFMKSGGFLGYFILSLMAFTSLLIKQPYTLQVSKKDYPEIYWKDRTFLTINNIITAVWAGIFLANATIFFTPTYAPYNNPFKAPNSLRYSFLDLFPSEGACLFRYKGV